MSKNLATVARKNWLIEGRNLETDPSSRWAAFLETEWDREEDQGKAKSVIRRGVLGLWESQAQSKHAVLYFCHVLSDIFSQQTEVIVYINSLIILNFLDNFVNSRSLFTASTPVS